MQRRPVGETGPERLRTELEHLRDLPTPPQVLQEIWQILGSEGSSAACLSHALEKDTALTAKLLRLANSAYFGLPRPVGEVRAACVVLGFDTVRALAVGVSSLDTLTRGAGTAIDLTAFWRHSVGTGVAAQLIARAQRMPAPGTALCGGILHDLGKLVLATLSPERYTELARHPGESLREAEKREFGGDHETVAIWLAERWRFPAEIRAAIGFHHEPWNADDENRWAALLHVADWMALGHGCPSVPWASPHPPEAPDPRASEILAISADTLDEQSRRFAGELEKVETFVELARG